MIYLSRRVNDIELELLRGKDLETIRNVVKDFANGSKTLVVDLPPAVRQVAKAVFQLPPKDLPGMQAVIEEAIYYDRYFTWLKQVDQEIIGFGFNSTHSEMYDQPWEKWHSDGVTPKAAAGTALYGTGYRND